MRSKVMWTINNQSDRKLHYGLYKSDDKAMRWVLDSMYGEIEAGHSVDVDVAQSQLGIRFWKDLPTLGIGGDPYTDGNVVNTNAPVTIATGGKVTQGKANEFSEKPAGQQVTFLDAAAGSMSDNDLVRSVFLLAAGKIPVVGGAVEGVLGLIWPEDKQSPEALMKKSEERMKRWVQGLVNEYDLDTMKSELAGVRRSIAEYHATKNPPERRTRLDGCIAAIDHVIDHFTKKKYTPGSLSFVMELAMLHLTLLRERVVFTRAIYDSEIDKPLYERQLSETIAEYQRFVHDVGIQKEVAWRMEQIKADPLLGRENKVYGWYVKDSVTREVHQFSLTGRSLYQGPAEICLNFYKAQAANAYARELHAWALDTSLLWSRVMPGHEHDKPIGPDRFVWTGPYAGLSYMVGNEHNFPFGDVHEQTGRRLSRIKVRAWDRIDALRFDFDGGTGRWFGNTAGGAEHTIDLPEGVFLLAIETWWNFDLFAIALHLSDGTQHTFGKHGPGEIRQNAAYPDHAVRAIKLADRMHELHVGFVPLPDYYTRIAKT